MITATTALMALFNATGGAATWTNHGGWGEGDPCAEGWFGICCQQFAVDVDGLPTCGGAPTAHITGINLQSNNLVGSLPLDPAVWSSFTELQSLILRTNKIAGVLPPALGLLSPTNMKVRT